MMPLAWSSSWTSPGLANDTAPGTDIGTLDQAYVPPAIQKTELRRRPLSERSVA